MCTKMWSHLYLVCVYINFVKCLSANNSIPSPIHRNEEKELDCENGKLLSKSVCIPNGYLEGEVPERPTVVSTKIEINNIREVNDKKMRITLDFYQELIWVDNRIRTQLIANIVLANVLR